MCYALKGNYTRYKAIKAAQYVRLASLKNELWTAAIVYTNSKTEIFQMARRRRRPGLTAPEQNF